MATVRAPGDQEDWIAISDDPLPLAEAATWAVLPGCGAVVTFTGTARDHARSPDGSVRGGVTALEYEAYTGPALERMGSLATEARRRWPVIGRIALLHRTGMLAVGDAAVTVVVSTPHRAEAFDAARWLIDTLKADVPIWKKEAWEGGSDWGGDARPVSNTVAGGAA